MLAWTDPGDASITNYQSRHKAGTSFSDGDDNLWMDIADSGASTTSHTVTELTNGTEYVFQVRAVNAGGPGTVSDPATATPVADLMPDFGTATVADQSYVQNTQITTLNLPQATGGDGTLTYSLSPDAPDGLAFDAANQTLSGTPTTGQAATAYTYTATDADGDTASLTFDITIQSLAPVAPTDLSATAGDALVALAWSNPQDSTITKYQVRYGAGSAVPATATWGDITDSGAGTTSHTVTGLTNGTQYAFEIRAVNAGGNSDASSTVTATPAQSQTSQTNAPSISLLQADRAGLVVNWNWVDTTGGACSMDGANSGFEIEYKKATEPNWKLAWQTTANTADHGVFELYNQQNWDRGLAPNGTLLTTFTIDADAEGREPVSQSGVALDAVQYQVRMLANSDSPDTSCDVAGSAYSAIASVTVLPANQAPSVASAIADQSVVSGASATVDISSTFSDPDNDTLTYTASSDDTAKATVALSGTTLTLTGAAPGTAKVTVTATDPYGAAVSDEFDVTVTNNAPTVANAIADQTVDVGSTVAVALETDGSEVFADPDSNPLTYTATSGDTALATVAVDNAANTVTVTGVAAGTPTITVTAIDGYGGTVSDDFTVTVNQPNRAPTVANAVDDQSVAVNATANVDVSAVFNDLDNDTLTLSASSSDTATATASLSGTTLTLTGVALGTAQVTLTAADGNGGQASDTFDVTVTSSAPVVANPIANAKVGPGLTRDIDLTPVFSDPDGDTLTYSASSSNTGRVTVSLTDATLTVRGSALGTATVTVTAEDTSGASVSNQFDVTVQNAIKPAAPTNVSLTAATGQITVAWDWSDNTGGVCLLTGDRSGFEIQYKKSSLGDDWHEGHDTHPNAVDHGVFELIGPGQGSLRQFVIKEGATGNGDGQIGVALDPVDYDVRILAYSGPCEDSSVEPRDPNSDYSAIATTSLNNAPTAADNTVTTNEDTAYTFDAADFNFSDVDSGDTLASVKITGLETAGALQLSGADVTQDQVITAANIDGDNLTFTPAANAHGDPYASFQFSVNDGKDDSAASHTMTIDVTAVNDAPTVADAIGARTVAIGSNLSVALETDGSEVFNDDDGDTLTYSATSATETAATVTVDNDANTITLTGVAAGTSEITVTAADGNGGSVTDTFTLTVTSDPGPTNNPPTASDNTVTTDEDTAYTFDAADFNFSDIDTGDALASVKITGLETAGTLQLSGADVTQDQVITAANIDADNLTFTPAANANGDPYATFRFSVNDGEADSTASYTMTIDVTPVNDAPTVANAIPDQTAIVASAFSYAFPADTFADVDNDSLTYTAQQSNGTALPTWLSFTAATRTFSGTPQTADEGTLPVQVTANDGNNGQVSDTFDITVVGTPDAPTGLTASAGDGQVSLSWNNPTDSSITRYQLRHGAGATVPDSATWADIGGSGAATTTHTVTGLSNGTQYAFEIRAVNAAGNSDASDTATATPAASGGGGGTDLTPTFGNETIADQNYTQNAAIDPLTLPAATSGNGTLTYSLSPALPAGLSFNAATRQLSGTPTEVFAQTEFSYTATDVDGDSATLTFNITVVETDVAPSFGDQTISDLSFTKDEAIETLTLPRATSGNGRLTYRLSPTLPAGLSFNAATRQLSGTPSEVFAQTRFRYTATDVDGDSATLTFNLTVVEADVAPSFGDATIADQNYTQNAAIDPLTLPEATGGNGTLSYSLSPELPEGLGFDAATRQLSGTPTEAFAQTEFSYTATDVDGDSATLTFNITVGGSGRSPEFRRRHHR